MEEKKKKIYGIKFGGPDMFSMIQALNAPSRTPLSMVVFEEEDYQNHRTIRLILTGMDRVETDTSGKTWKFRGRVEGVNASDIGLYPCRVEGVHQIGGAGGFEVIED